MTALVEALRTQGLVAKVSLGGRWVELQGEYSKVFVYQAPWGDGYYTWCDDAAARAIEFYRDPTEAIEAGLRRAGG